MKIENQLEKEFKIFSKISDMCSCNEYINQFKALYPEDIKNLNDLFESNCKQGKNFKKDVKSYLRQSYVNGRLRYRIKMGIINTPPEKKQKITSRCYLITDDEILYSISEAKLLDKVICVKPNKDNPGKHLWYFKMDNSIKRLIHEHNRKMFDSDTVKKIKI